MVRVSDAREAAQAAEAGIDAVELVLDAGPVPDLAAARETRRAFPKLMRLRSEGSGSKTAAMAAAASVEADEVAFALEASPSPSDAAGSGGPKAVGLLPAARPIGTLAGLRGAVDALMLETTGRTRLIDVAPIAAIDAFATSCRQVGLPFGLAGGLEAPDVARLLLLEPDVLAFDTAVRVRHAPDGALDPGALDAIRALVPSHRPPAGPTRIAKVTDRIFVRDFEVQLAIGAYQAEHGKHQRVAFSVVAETVREARAPQDMRDVFSYDIIIETIRVLAERGHVTFVETLAEAVAASLLAHPEVVTVEVKVAKLDVIQGSVGIEILRRRDAS